MLESLETDLLTLRWLGGGDRDEYVRIHELSAGEFGLWMPARDPDETLEQRFDRELAGTLASQADGSGIRMVAELPDGSLAGIFALNQIFRGPFQNAFAGWRVASDQTGKGLATAGVLALLDLAFEQEPKGLGLHRVQANVVPSNPASIRVAEKAGFRLEGLAQEYLQIDGRWQDHLMFAKLAREHTSEPHASRPSSARGTQG